MKKIYSKIGGLMAMMLMVTSCDAFLEEDPKTFLNPGLYFQNEKQTVAAVNGLYDNLEDIFSGDIEVCSGTHTFLEYLSGYGQRARGTAGTDLSSAWYLTVKEDNTHLETLWARGYNAIENCNSVIEGIEGMGEGILTEARKNELLGEAYYMRAYYYFELVRLFGPIPLKTTSTKDLSDVQIALSPVADVYTQIDADLTKAGELMEACAWNKGDGRASKGAVKSLHARVLLTMAGYPLQKTECYKRAYDMALEVRNSGAYSLFSTYEELRTVENSGEIIFAIQREADNDGSSLHNEMLPYPEPSVAISVNQAYGGALAPAQLFYNSYPAGDKRIDAFYYTEHKALESDDIVTFDRPFIRKYWDASAAVSGKSGADYTLIRYADVLLILAEAKAQVDGGTTTSSDAIDAYYAVRSRALPDEAKPASISVNDVLKERIWELCFEGQDWYDMLRTRKALQTQTGEMVNMIGYQTPGHEAPFKEADLLLPYPVREKRLNPNLVR